MAYTPTTWKSGDVVTSAKLNKLEQGVASTVFVVTLSHDEETSTYSTDKPYADILAAYEAGANLFCVPWEGAALRGMEYEEGTGFTVSDIMFNSIGGDGANMYITVYVIAADGTVNVGEGEYALTQA